VGCGVLFGALRCCLEMTGGSLANTSRKMAKKSRIFDFYSKALAPLIIKATSKTSEGKQASFPSWVKNSHPKTQPSLLNMDDKPFPVDRHVVQL